jgi:cell shape-determining protein MreC
MLTGLILLFAPQNLTNDLQFAFARVFRWPLTIGKNVSLYVTETQPAQSVNFDKKSEYENHIANLQAQLDEKNQELIEVKMLRDRSHALENAGLLMADVISSSINETRSELTINRGQNDGLAKGQFVLRDNSIIGTISDISPRTAKVTLFTDPASRIAVRIGNLNIDRLMQGRGKDEAKIRHPSMWDITVKPVCDIERLNSITVIIMNPQK